MSDSPAPRRSQREKKTTKPFVSTSAPSKRKRKRSDSGSEDDAPDVSEPEDPPVPSDDSSDEGDDEEENQKTPKARKPRAKTAKAKGPPVAKKPRIVKAPAASKPTAKRGRKVKEGDDAFDATRVAKDTKISADNPLFNAIVNPSAALQSTAEDFLESLDQTPGAAQAELVILILRACGCNDSIDGDEALDYDGVVDALDNFTEGLKQEDSPVYPLTSKLPVFKKFRKSLSEFIERLITSAADLGALYTSDLMATLQTWVIAMSSSQIRSFRHTATVVALEVETALCEVAAAVDKEAEMVGRQREGERKRKGSGKGGGAREKELEAKAQEVRKRRTALAEFIKEFVDGVFVHRYRDLDPNIRAECVRAIGLWFKKYPGHFLDAAYLRYVGWVLSDSTTQVRLEAVRSLSGVYEQGDYIGSLNHFTERFKPRLVEMATGDTELSVRVAVIQVLAAIDGHALLEDEERERLCLLLFDEEAKVRRAVSQFVQGVWEEGVEERLAGAGKPSQKDKERAGIKALAVLLVKWCKALDHLSGDHEESDSGDMDDTEHTTGESSSGPASRRKEVAALVAMEQRGRMALAVEALWEAVESVSDWEALLDILLLDHSAIGGDGDEVSRPRTNGKERGVNEIWRLEEVEEGVLLEVLVGAIRRAKAEVAGSKKGEEETVTNDITRALIKSLPRLFIKHQTDQRRIAEVLLIPTLMNLELYMEMRMIAAYTSLWDDVTKQFLSHSSLTVHTHAMAAIRHLMEATSLSNTNSTKILELEDEMSLCLRDAVAGKDEIEVASFSEDEVTTLAAICTRLAVLTGTRDMTAWMEENEGGKQSSAWEIISALIERGRLGYKEEETMVEQALHVLTLHIIWKGKGLTADNDPSPDEIRFRETLKTQRGALLEKLVEYAVGTQSNTIDGVKRAAFKHLLDLHVLFSSAQTLDADGSLLPTASVALSLEDEIQCRCAGYIQAEIERYADTLEEEDGVDDVDQQDSDEDDGSNADETERAQKAPKNGNRKKSHQQENKTSARESLEKEYLFIDVMSTFLRAIRAGAIDIRHGAVLLAHYGRLGPSFDVCSKVIVDVLREEGMMNDRGEIVVAVLTQAVREAYTLVLDGLVQDEGNCLSLTKLVSTCFVIRGSQLSIVRRLDSQFVVQVQTVLLTWIGKRIAVYESNKNKKSMKLAVTFFKVLIPLLSTIQSRDALKIKAHMDQVMAQARVEVSATSRLWEPARAYEKRLSSVTSKEKSQSGARKTPGKKRTAGISTEDEESEAEKADSVKEADVGLRRSSRNRPRNVVTDNEDEGDDSTSPKLATPNTRVRPKAAYRVKPAVVIASGPQSPNVEPVPSASPSLSPAPSTTPEENDQEEDVQEEEENPQESPQEFATPKASRKRARSQSDPGSPMETEIPAASITEQPPEPSDNPTGEIQIRRKRVRH
ncbi:hypothetical protein BD779DRAFT_1609978 [Infundibulicybe gibba]|nr:hypothetical protein BD779DRAFT_1609978 [Infundibulicybe gibba]